MTAASEPNFNNTVEFQQACYAIANRMGWQILDIGHNHVEYEVDAAANAICIQGDLGVFQLFNALSLASRD